MVDCSNAKPDATAAMRAFEKLATALGNDASFFEISAALDECRGASHQAIEHTAALLDDHVAG